MNFEALFFNNGFVGDVTYLTAFMVATVALCYALLTKVIK